MYDEGIYRNNLTNEGVPYYIEDSTVALNEISVFNNQ